VILDEIETLIGDRLMLRFLAIFAGTDVHFPKRRSAASYVNLVHTIGEEAASRLRARFVGETVYVPRNADEARERRNAEIAALVRAGESPAAVARRYRIVTTLSERHVRRIVEQATKESM